MASSFSVLALYRMANHRQSPGKPKPKFSPGVLTVINGLILRSLKLSIDRTFLVEMRRTSMSQRHEIEEKVRQKLKELESEIESLREQLEGITAELLPDHEDRFKKLHALHDKSCNKLDELLEASDESFEAVQETMEEYWSSVGREMRAFDLKLRDS
jgi:hypothetical protein